MGARSRFRRRPAPSQQCQPVSEIELIPVGFILQSLNDINPGLPVAGGGLGYGVWQRIAKGRTLIGVDEDDPSLNISNISIGDKTATTTGTVSQASFSGLTSQNTSSVSAGIPSGTISQPTFTGNPITQVINHTHPVVITDPGHNHTQNPHNHGLSEGQTDGAGTFMDRSNAASATTSVTDNATATNNSNTTGITASTSNPAGGVTSIIPTGSISQPIFAGDALGNHSHTITAAGTISNQTFTGNAVSIIQPSLTVYIWIRIA